MTEFTINLDMSDCKAVLLAARKLEDHLPWPRREEYRTRLHRIMEEDRAVEFHRISQGDGLAVFASAELLDLMRDFGPSMELGQRTNRG